MYFANWGENAQIERANMDGSNRTVLVSQGIEYVNGLTLDYEQRRLYWGDARFDRIEFIYLDIPNIRRVVIRETRFHIWGLHVLGKFYLLL